jgi:O-antigen/teichoic acid export membrane protein
MMGLRAIGERVWQKRHSPELWLLASNLMMRGLGFVVSLLVSRMAGVNALGLYSGLLITGASPTTPVSAVLSNNATLLAVRHHGAVPLASLLRAHGPVFLLSALMAGVGCWVMLVSSNLMDSSLVSARTVAIVAAGLVLGQLVTQLAVGLSHGADLSRQSSMVICAAVALSLLLAYPVLLSFGLAGVMLQAMAFALAPGLVLSLWFMRRRAGPVSKDGGPEGTRAEVDAALAAETAQGFRHALPNVLATVVNNATNWVSCIYLAERYHGHAGLGLVAIGLQWMALMQLPVTSWSGRIMRDLAVAKGASPDAFRREIWRQARKCVAVSFLASAAVLTLSGWVAGLYKADAQVLFGLFAVNALAATLAGVNVVYERAFFCMGSQRPWLLISVGAYVVQLLVTLAFIRHGVLAVAAGNLVAIVLVLVLVSVYLFKVLGTKRGAT